MAGTGEPQLVRPFPNTNIMYGSTVIPTIYFRLSAGTHCIADYFSGDGSFSDKGRAIALPQFFYAQGHVRKSAALLHASRAMSRESLPYSIAQGRMMHPREVCQPELTDALRANRGKKRFEILFGEEKIVIEF